MRAIYDPSTQTVARPVCVLAMSTGEEIFHFAPAALPANERSLRDDVRAFIADRRDLISTKPIDSWMTPSPEFSRLLGERGWIGMTWPKEYGGRDATMLDRYVVVEELLAAGAPMGAHWIADRQSGPLLLRYGTKAQRAEILPRIVEGTCYFAIGMSEPNSGSDLASIATRAEPVEGGWRLNGSKIWTSFAQHCTYMICLCRTAPKSDDRHAGLSQLLVDLSSDGVEIRPIVNLAGDAHFNEIFFDDVFVADTMVLGEVNEGWQQVLSELAFERSGPERFLSTFRLLEAAIDYLGPEADERSRVVIGRLSAQLMTLRHMSLSVASALQEGRLPNVEAAIVKDLGTSFEQAMPEIMRTILSIEARPGEGDALEAMLGEAVLLAPSFSLRGGTREILRGIIARGLGLR